MEFCKALNRDKLNYEEVWAEGRIRQNITLHEENNPETRISFSGFSCDKNILRKVSNRIIVEGGSIVTFTGSVPKGLSVADVKELLSEVKNEGAKLVVDSRSFTFDDLIEMKPWLIEPNRTEATNYFGKEVRTVEAAVEIAQKFYDGGVENVIISMGGAGAVLVCVEGVYVAEAPKCTVVSTIGAGDSLIAGFIHGSEKELSVEETLRLAVACGSAACMTDGTRPPEKAQIEEISQKIAIKKLR